MRLHRLRPMGLALAALAVCLLPTARLSAAAPKFDSANAFAALKKQCDFGPRPPGTPAHDRTLEYLAGELRRYTSAVSVEQFPFRISGGVDLQMSNIIARFGDTSRPGILLCAHWDTRPTADAEMDLAKRSTPIVGANDGASGVAVLLELARCFNQTPPSVPVTIALFDGEDYGPGSEDMFVGSRRFAAGLAGHSYRYGVLLDMVGDSDLRIRRETNSERAAMTVNDRIWAAAARLGYADRFPEGSRCGVIDDHIPLIKAGLPCVDIIDFDYRYWHTTRDTADKCSASSLGVVGEVIADLVYSERP